MVATNELTEGTVRAEKPYRRYSTLDGLRGIAAFVVLICHVCLVSPTLFQAYMDPDAIERWSSEWWVSFSPVHLGWAGTEAVYLFFVLSGFVLALPFTGGSYRSWAGYYPKRFLRLYLPVWVAVAVAFGLFTLFPREFAPGASHWLQARAASLPAEAIRSDLLLFPTPGFSNTALWSLRFEVLFSLLLPAFVLFGRHLPRLNALKAVLLLAAVIGFAGSGLTARYFLPMFGLGTLMAFERHRLAALGAACNRLRFRRGLWWGLALLALALLNSYWTILGFTSGPQLLAWLVPLSRGLIVAGACLILFVAIECSSGWLERPPFQWLGMRSFSLYLVHEPIVVSAALWLGGTPSVPLLLAVAAPVSLVAAEALYRLVEYPSQRLSRLAESKIANRKAGARSAPVSAPARIKA